MPEPVRFRPSLASFLEKGVQVGRYGVQEAGGAHSRQGGACRARSVVHPYAALVFFTGGNATVEQEGRWELAPGDVMLVPAGTPHRMIHERHAERWGVGFCMPCFAGELSSLFEPFERARAGGAAVVTIASERRARLEGLLGELELAVARRDRAGAAVQKSLLALVLDEIVRAAPPLGEAPSRGGELPLVAASLRYIERHCLGPLTLGELAAAVGKSPAHLTTVLRRATGKSAVQWMIAGRLAEARRLLSSSDEPVERIAERVGYADATHFIRLFRRQHGVTPAAWRAGAR
jgi:AraC family transcriptional regulator, transcriptional activator of pobA